MTLFAAPAGCTGGGLCPGSGAVGWERGRCRPTNPPLKPPDVEREPIEVSAVTVEVGEVYVGQAVTLSLRAHVVTNEELVGVRITDTPHVEVVSYEVLPAGEAGTMEVSVTIAGFRPGVHAVSGLTLRFLTLDGATVRAVTPAFELPILAVLSADDDELVPPGDFVPVYTKNLSLLYGGGLLAGGFLLGLAALLWRRRKLANTPVFVEAATPAPSGRGRARGARRAGAFGMVGVWTPY